MKFNVTFKVAWDDDYEFVDFEFDSKDLETLHKNIKLAIEENYLAVSYTHLTLPTKRIV